MSGRLLVSLDEEPYNGGRHQNGESGDIDQKEEKIAVVPLSNAVAHPGTMVIEFGHTYVAAIAVLGPRRPKDVARRTISISTRSTQGDAVVRDGRLDGGGDG